LIFLPDFGGMDSKNLSNNPYCLSNLSRGTGVKLIFDITLSSFFLALNKVLGERLNNLAHDVIFKPNK
jgi:hypothetical protein